MESSVADTETRFIESPGGLIETRYYPAAEPNAPAVLCVGGVSGGFDSPAMNLYGRLAADLPGEGLSVLRVRYRNPTDLNGCVSDVRAGVGFLRSRSLGRIALIGHSFGGAVVIRAAVWEPAVATVITLATQGYGTEDAGLLQRPVLLIHGAEDEVFPPFCSEHVYERLGHYGHLRIFPRAKHGLHEVAEEVRQEVMRWLERHLGFIYPNLA